YLGYVLPVLSVALSVAAYIYRFVRVSVIETISAPYVRSAILRGFSSRRVLWLHVLPNATGAFVNVVALNFISLAGGVLVIENVFSYPGLGTLLLDAINSKAFPLIAAIALIWSSMIV